MRLLDDRTDHDPLDFLIAVRPYGSSTVLPPSPSRRKGRTKRPLPLHPVARLGPRFPSRPTPSNTHALLLPYTRRTISNEHKSVLRCAAEQTCAREGPRPSMGMDDNHDARHGPRFKRDPIAHSPTPLLLLLLLPYFFFFFSPTSSSSSPLLLLLLRANPHPPTSSPSSPSSPSFPSSPSSPSSRSSPPPPVTPPPSFSSPPPPPPSWRCCLPPDGTPRASRR